MKNNRIGWIHVQRTDSVEQGECVIRTSYDVDCAQGPVCCGLNIDDLIKLRDEINALIGTSPEGKTPGEKTKRV